MTNEEIYEEVLFAAYEKGIHKEVIERVKQTPKEYSNQTPLDLLVRAYYTEKRLLQERVGSRK